MSRLLYDWFGESVSRFTDLPALEVGDHRLSYAELDRLVRGLATRIVAANGGRSPRRVGLHASRSLVAYCGYLAIARLGAAPVPLGPSIPAARNATIAAQAELDLIVRGPEASGADLGFLVLDVTDQDLTGPGASGADLPPPQAGVDDIAHILFTSGSTGIPKGVPLTHRNAFALISHLISRYELGPGARMSQVAELTFDMSMHDMFMAWAAGATLVVPARSELVSPADFVSRRGLTHWFSVPSIISIALSVGELPVGSMPSLRWGLFGGEPLTMQQARAWLAAAPNSALGNLYGPTELTACCEYHLTSDPSTWPVTSNGTVPIGAPFPGMEWAVVDEEGRPASSGELIMRGLQMFPGYLDPADNAGRFARFDGSQATVLRQPEVPEGAWYRTGDRIEFTGDAMVHLGRLDHQVKIRGNRVEVGEVEALLRAWPGVRDAVVVAVPAAAGDMRLCAAASGTGLDANSIRAYLAARLPDYMVPGELTFLDQLPLNPNGKIDRKVIIEALDAASSGT